MRQPKGFDDGSGRSCRIIRSLYGLRQAARCWNKLMHRELSAVGYHQIYSDAAVYVHRSANSEVTILAIHVDNVLSFANTEIGLKSTCNQLHIIFAMKEENPNWSMGFNKSQTIYRLCSSPLQHARMRPYRHTSRPRDCPIGERLPYN